MPKFFWERAIGVPTLGGNGDTPPIPSSKKFSRPKLVIILHACSVHVLEGSRGRSISIYVGFSRKILKFSSEIVYEMRSRPNLKSFEH